MRDGLVKDAVTHVGPRRRMLGATWGRFVAGLRRACCRIRVPRGPSNGLQPSAITGISLDRVSVQSGGRRSRWRSTSPVLWNQRESNTRSPVFTSTAIRAPRVAFAMRIQLFSAFQAIDRAPERLGPTPVDASDITACSPVSTSMAMSLPSQLSSTSRPDGLRTGLGYQGRRTGWLTAPAGAAPVAHHRLEL
jgi:hypothetical protein